MKNKTLSVALVGCGRISKNHFNAINREKSLKLVAICDINIQRLNYHKKKYSIPGFESFETMLEECKSIEAVILCTPSGIHASQAILASSYKKHVITEKPMATYLKDGLKMVDSCKKNRVKLFVIKQNRYNETLLNLKKAVDDKRFGNLIFVQVNVFWNRNQSYYDADEWKGTRKLDGGALMNQASHYVDLLCWLFGQAQSVYADFTTNLKIETEDTGTLSLRWKSKLIGSLNFTMRTYPENLEGSITVIGDKGTVKIGGKAVNNFDVWSFSNKKNIDKILINKKKKNIKSIYGSGHFKFYKELIKSFKNSQIQMTDGNQGLLSLKLMEAAYKSALKRKRVIIS